MIYKFTKTTKINWLIAIAFLTMLPGMLLAQVDVNSTGGTLSASYPTLKASFDAINLGTHTGTINIGISASTTETATALLSASGTGSSSYSKIIIAPTGGGARTISGAITAGSSLIDLNGADNVLIDGLYSGGNSLTISNTTASNTTGTSTIRFIGGATSNTITNCFVFGSFNAAVTTNGGNIFFSTDANTPNGNDNNVVSYCNIGPAGTNLPTKGIYMNGSTATTAINNSGNTILNNYIFDYFGAAVSSAGIYIAGGNTDHIIQNNLFYQTGPRTQTTGAQHSAIWITNTSGNNFQVTGNTIGYASSSQTGLYSMIGVASSAFVPIFLNVGTTVASNASSNTISGINFSGALSGTSSGAPFRSIYVGGGLVACNTNSIGSQSSTSSIRFSSNLTTAADVIGIFNFGTSSFTTNGNVIGGFDLSNLSTGATNFYGLRTNTAAGVTWVCNNNIIGGSIANSINNTSTAAGSIVNGILNSNPAGTFTNNIIRNMTTAGGTGTGSSASMTGIVINATSSNHTLSNNTIYNLSNTFAGAGIVNGINFSSSTGTNIIEKNLIYSLDASNIAAVINGINISGGTATYKNNMIRLGVTGSSSTIGMAINGINETAGTNNIWHNSIYIGGAPSTGTANTFAFQSSVTTNVRSFQNNIFYNARSNNGSTGKHYAIRVGGATTNPAGLTSNFNILYAPGTGGYVGLFNAIDQSALSNWTTATGQDLSSYNTDPQYIAPTAAVPDLHINPSVLSFSEGLGNLIASVTDDYDNQARAGLTPIDIGADAFNGISPAPSISTLSVTPSGNQCVTVSHNVLATIAPGSASLTAVTLNYSFNGVAQPTIAMTGGSSTTTSTWNATIPVAVPSNGLVSWTVTVTDGSFTKTSAGTSYKDEPLAGLTATATISPNTICAGNTATLSAFMTGSVVTGTNTTVNSTSSYPAAYGSYWGNGRTQFLVLASELQALGLQAGNVTSVAFDVTSVGTPSSLNGYTIKMAPTSLGSLTAFQGGAFTTVYSNTYTPTVGTFSANTHSFSTPFAWDGSSNVVLDICFSNQVTGSSNTQTRYSATTFNSAIYYGADGVAGAGACSSTTVTGGPYLLRPNMMFTGSKVAGAPYTFNWSDGTSTIATTSVAVVSPTTNTTYSATLTDGNGCSITSSAVTLTVNPLPPTPVATNTTQCGVGVSSASVSGGTGYNWYATPTSTAVLQTGTDNTYTTSISSTTTLYVSSNDGTCLSPRTAVTTSVSLPDAVIASASATMICPGDQVLLSSTQGTVNVYSFTWTATPATGSGIPTSMTGQTINIAPVTPGTYVYQVYATDGICATTSTVEVTLNNVPSITASASPTMICSGESVNLNATTPAIAAGMVAIGTSTTLTGATAQPTAFCNRWSSYRMQTVYTATELNAAGLIAGNITSISYSISTLGDAATNSNYTVKCGTTAIAAFTNFIPTTGFSTVYTPAVYTHSVGLNTITFNSPYIWDGSSNLVVEVSHDGANDINNAQTYYTTTATNMLAFSTNGSATGTPSTSRLNIIFNGQTMTQIAGDLNWQWNPGAINSNTTTVSPINTGSVAATQIYTVTATNTVTGCSANETVSITVNPIPSAPVAMDGVQCGVGVPSASVSGGTLYYWYSSPTSTVVLQSGSSSNYTNSISSTITWYIASSNGSCMSPRVALTQTVATPPAFTLNSPSAICAGSEIGTFSVTSTISDYDSYIWSPTADIYSDPTATTSYIGENTSQVYVKRLTPGVLAINASASNSVTGCVAMTSTTISIKEAPTTITVSATPTLVCAGNTVSLSATANTPPPVVVLSEGFNGASNNWNVTDNSSATLPNVPWHLAADGSSNSSPEVIHSNDNSQFMMTDANSSAGSLTVNTKLTSPAFSTQGLLSADLKFYHYYYYGSASYHDDGVIRMSTDNATWTTVRTYTTNQGTPAAFALATVTVPAAFMNKPVVYLQFQSTGGWGYYWHIDNVSIVGVSALSYDYSWTSTPAGFTSNTSTATAMPTGTTDYSVVITNTATSCSNSGIVTVSVNPVPSVTAMASPTVICAGSTATLTAGGATNYTWTSGGNGTTETVTPSTMATYTVYGETNGCVGSSTVNVDVNAIPSVMTAASPTAVCAGSSATLTASGATNYTWTNGGSANTEVVTPGSLTIYTVTGENSGCAATATVSVDVNAIPTVFASASQTILCENGSTGSSILTASSTATSFMWSDGAMTMTTSVTPTTTTIYTVTVTEMGCSAEAMVTITVNNCTGIKSVTLAGSDVNMYPNPTNGILNVSISSLEGNTSIELYDALGKLTLKEILSNDLNTISLNQFEDGIYFFKVINNNKTVKVGKVVKQ
ncbi:MAG: T9SS type A sorting domain-containing protein [Bacteroidota bacterium]